MHAPLQHVLIHFEARPDKARSGDVAPGLVGFVWTGQVLLLLLATDARPGPARFYLAGPRRA